MKVIFIPTGAPVLVAFERHRFHPPVTVHVQKATVIFVWIHAVHAFLTHATPVDRETL